MNFPSTEFLVTLAFGCSVLALQVQAGGNKRSVLKHGEAYGGVLKQIYPSPANDSDIQLAASFAVRYAQMRHPSTMALDEYGQIAEYDVTNASKLKLVYTSDGISPQLVEMMDTSLMPSLQPLILGVTYSFQVAWQPPFPWQHSFVVTQYWGDQMYIFKHTFHQQRSSTTASIILDTKPSTISDHSSFNFIHESENKHSIDIGGIYRSHQYQQASCDTRSEQTCTINEPYKSNIHNFYDMISKYVFKNSCNRDEDIESLSNEEPTGLDLRMKVLCYNIWNTNALIQKPKGYVDRIQHLAKLIQQSGADVVGLQEVRFHGDCCGSLGPNQVEHLAAYLPDYQFVYQPAQIQHTELPERVEEGVAFFSKYPILKHKYTLLSRNMRDAADSHQRIILHVLLQLPGIGKVHVLNTHLSLSHHARATSVIEIWNYIQKLKGPVLLMGDFNAESHNEEIRFLQGRHSLKGVNTHGLFDVWRLQYGDSNKGFTFNTLEEHLSKRIDFILVRKHEQMSVSDVYLLDDQSRGIEAPSDHLGLVAEFIMHPPEEDTQDNS